VLVGALIPWSLRGITQWLSVVVEVSRVWSMGPSTRQEEAMDLEDVARRRRRIVVQGPLAPFTEGLREDLAGQGFSPDTIVDHVHRLADLSRWLVDRDLVGSS
jgi:hypothetical protein